MNLQDPPPPIPNPAPTVPDIGRGGDVVDPMPHPPEEPMPVPEPLPEPDASGPRGPEAP